MHIKVFLTNDNITLLWQFVLTTGTKSAYLYNFFVARELEQHYCI